MPREGPIDPVARLLRRGAPHAPPERAIMPRVKRQPSPPKSKPRRASYDLEFKHHVVQTALLRPANNRIKPTCALFPGIEPCQVRPPSESAA